MPGKVPSSKPSKKTVKGKRKSEEEAPEVPKKVESLGSIKSLLTFRRHFPEITIEKPFSLLEWSDSHPTHKQKMYDWLVEHVRSWLTTYKYLPNITNEATLYPYIFDILKSLLSLTNNLIVESKVEKEISNEALDAAVFQFVEQQSARPSAESLGSQFTDANESTMPSKADAEAIVDEPSVPLVVDTTAKEEVKELYLGIEHWLSHEKSEGRVEFTVLDEVTQRVQCVLEVKLSVATDKQQGLYQCCAYMVAAQVEYNLPVTYGVYTDFRSWVFLKLEHKRITYSPEFSLFHTFKVKFQTGAYSIFAYLFEMFGIPTSVHIASSESKAAEQLHEEAQRLLSGLM